MTWHAERALLRYLPRDRRRALALGVTLDDHPRGCALFADVSGFTPLTEALLTSFGGQRGAEILAGHLNAIYEAIIAPVHAYNGSVIAFSGDAVTCWFEKDHGSRALACALAMQDAMAPLKELTTPDGQRFRMGLKVAAAAGQVRRFLVGDPNLQRIEVLAGRLMGTLAAGEGMAREGEVLLSETTAHALEGRLRLAGWRQSTASQREPFAVIEGFLPGREPAAPQPGPPAHPPLEAILPWIHPLIRQRHQAGLGGYMAELRLAVAQFLRFTGLDYDGDPQAGEKMDAFVRRVQHTVERFGGILMQLSTGDKGTYLYSAFGAPISHENDALRAARAAESLHALQPEFPYLNPLQIGISRGLMRVGDYGSQERGIYGVQGNEANIAARLMSMAQPRQTLVTGHVAREVEAHYRLHAQGDLSLKGQVEAVPVQALGERRAEGVAAFPVAHPNAPLIGREAELQVLSSRLGPLKAGKGGLVLLEGEAGIGKTRLLDAWRAQAQDEGIPVILGGGQAVDQGDPYHAWRPVFQTLLAGIGGTDASSQREALLDALGGIPDGTPRAPLLNPVLPFAFDETEETTHMRGEVRAGNARRLMVDLLARGIAAGPSALVMEDAQWMDSASLALLEQAGRDLPETLIVVSLRPPEGDGGSMDGAEGFQKAYQNLGQGAGARIRLGALSRELAARVAAHRLGVEHLPGELVRFIGRKAEGHPYLSQEVALALRDAGLIRVVNGRLELPASTGDFHTLEFPSTIQEVLISRLDRLPPEQLMTLKAASVIGRDFSLAGVQALDPLGRGEGALLKDLKSLRGLAIVRRVDASAELPYRFAQNMTREVIYQLMLFSQRRDLHRSAAQWYESLAAAGGGVPLARLAHHWAAAVEEGSFQAHDHARALHYLERAGEEALKQSAYREAVGFFRRALALVGRDPTRAAKARKRGLRARYNARLGEAYRGWGHFAESLGVLERAVALYGEPIPSSNVGLALTLLAQVALQVWRRLVPKRGRVSPGTLEAAALYQFLGEMYFFANRKVHSLFTIVRMLNMAEGESASRQLAEALAATSLITGLFGLHEQAEHYYRRALAVAEQLNDPSVTADVLRVNGFYRMGVGQWEAARGDLERALEIHQPMGDLRHAGDCLALLAHIELYQGRSRRGLEFVDQIVAANVEYENPTQEVWGRYQAGVAALRLGRLEEALLPLDEAMDLAERYGEETAILYLQGLRAQVHWRLGRRDAALADARRAMELIAATGGRPSSYSALDGYMGPAEVFLGMLEAWQDLGPAQRERLDKEARQACKYLHTYRRFFPIGRPAAWIYQGLLDWRGGRKARAQQAWGRALEAAQELGMPFEEARARYELGRHLPLRDPQRHEHLGCACELFAQIDAAYELKLAKGAFAG